MLLRTILRDRARTSRIASLVSRSESSFAVSGVEEDAPPPPRNVDVGKRPRRRLKQPLPLPEAIALIREKAKAKFDETFELVVKLGIDPKRGDQMVRGMALLPHGTGKAVRVALFTMGGNAEETGADVVGGEELIESIRSGGSINFDKCVATPDMMPKLAKIAKILGPKGLMPNPKLGTVTTDVKGTIEGLKRGKIEFRNDRGGLIHAGVGKLSFSDTAIGENVHALVDALLLARPKGVKGGAANGYLHAAYMSSTMGAGVPVSVSSIMEKNK